MIYWTTIRPRGPWLVVKVDPQPTMVRGLHIPDFLTEYQRGQTATGIVLRVGNGVEKVLGAPLKEGDSVLFRDFVKEVTVKDLEPHEDGCRVCLLQANDLVAIVDTI